MAQRSFAACGRILVNQFKRMQISPTTATCCVQKREMRSLKKVVWQIEPVQKPKIEHITPENRAFLNDFTAEIYKQKAETSPLKSEPWPRGQWTPQSVRCGLIAKKIGIVPQYDKKGRLYQCTLLQVVDNHVLSYTDPITWYKQAHLGKKSGKKILARITVGANSTSPSRYTAAYRGLFEEAGVMPKERIAAFAVTPDAKIQPGTRLHVTHFKVGQYVDILGKTRDRGFQGVMKRWGFAGGRADCRGTTKAHRRPGSIGHREWRHVKIGKKMAGHMGNIWRILRGSKILRINTKYQVIYVNNRGVQGPIGSYVYVRDCGYVHRRVENPYFPTHYPEEEKESLPEEYFDKDLFNYTEPTITFKPEEEKKLTTKVGIKVKKQAKAKEK